MLLETSQPEAHGRAHGRALSELPSGCGKDEAPHQIYQYQFLLRFRAARCAALECASARLVYHALLSAIPSFWLSFLPPILSPAGVATRPPPPSPPRSTHPLPSSAPLS